MQARASCLAVLSLATVLALPFANADEHPAHPRGFAAYQRYQGQLQTGETLHVPDSSGRPEEFQLLDSHSEDPRQISAVQNSVGLQLALCICLALCGFAVGWRVCAGQSKLQLEAAALRFQADFDSLRQQQIQGRQRFAHESAITEGANPGSAVTPAPQLVLEDASDSSVAHKPALDLLHVDDTTADPAEASASGAASSTLQPAHDGKPDTSAPAACCADPEASDSQSSSSSVAEEGDLVLVRQPAAVSSSAAHCTAPAAAPAATAVSTPARPPNQRMQDTAGSPAMTGTSLFSQAEISDAAAMVAAIHVGLRDQGVPDAQRALVADNVLSTLHLQKRQQHHDASFR